MSKIFQNDNSDSTIHFKYICEIRFPILELKDLLWQSITDFKRNKDEFQVYRNKCFAFFQPNIEEHYTMVEPYLDKYYEVAKAMITDTSFSDSKANAFITIVCPLLYRKQNSTTQDI